MNARVLCAATVVAAAVVLVACAPGKPAQTAQTSYFPKEPTPVCKTEAQCDAMWVTARETLQMVTRMPVKAPTDRLLETDVPGQDGQMKGKATQVALPDGTREIRVDLDCRAEQTCDDLRARGKDLFNMKVRAAGVPYQDAAK